MTTLFVKKIFKILMFKNAAKKRGGSYWIFYRVSLKLQQNSWNIP